MNVANKEKGSDRDRNKAQTEYNLNGSELVEKELDTMIDFHACLLRPQPATVKKANRKLVCVKRGMLYKSKSYKALM